MEDEQVIDQQQPPAPPKEGGKSKEPETVSIPKSDYERLQRQINELQESERFWASRARGGDERPEPEEEDEPDVSALVPKVTGNEDVDDAIFSDPDKWTEAISRGPKAIEQFIRKAGYVTAEDAARIAVKAAKEAVGNEVRRFTTDTELFREYPDLKDRNSDLWKETQQRFQKAVARNPKSQHDPNTLFLAAEAASLVLKAKARPRDEGGRFAADDDQYDRYEDDRRARVDAQGGSRSRRGGEPDDEQDMLGPELKQMCRDMGVSEADFIKNRRAMNGERGRRR